MLVKKPGKGQKAEKGARAKSVPDLGAPPTGWVPINKMTELLRALDREKSQNDKRGQNGHI